MSLEAIRKHVELLESKNVKSGFFSIEGMRDLLTILDASNPDAKAPTDFGIIIHMRPVEISGEDFVYQGTALFEFRKTNGKRRFMIEENGRLFVQSPKQVRFLDAEG